MSLSSQDSRLKLLQFEVEHLKKAIPMKVATRSSLGRKYCFIDMLFVGLRNTKDFDSAEDIVQVQELLRKLDISLKTPYHAVPHRIVFAEIFMRFRRDYTAVFYNDKNGDDKTWSVSFYKILTFGVLNYDPKS